jgi:hypothetical protein
MSPGVALCGLTWEPTAARIAGRRLAWPGAGRRSPRLAPRDLVSKTDLRMITAVGQPGARLQPTTLSGLTGWSMPAAPGTARLRAGAMAPVIRSRSLKATRNACPRRTAAAKRPGWLVYVAQPGRVVVCPPVTSRCPELPVLRCDVATG